MTASVTRRALAAGIGATAATALIPRTARANLTALEDAARKEATLTWYVAQMSGEAAEAMGHRFTRRYPGVSVAAIRTTGQVAYQRVMQELKNGAPQCDVFSTTDIAHMPDLKQRNALARYEAENAGALAAPFQGLGDPGYYYPTTASYQGLVYSTAHVKPDDVPRACTDLLDSKWQGRIGLAHPAFSGYFGQWVLAMRKLHGWKFFEKLAKNNPRIGRSGNDPLTLVNAGECLVGTGPLSTTMQNVDKGNPVGFIYPEDATVITVGPSAVLAAAPHPNAARLFLEWLFSLDYAQACAEWHLEPVRADAPPMKGTRRIGDFKSIALTTREIAKGIPEVIEQWRDTFGN
jgi:iron(III) transport system substrate-binding protein